MRIASWLRTTTEQLSIAGIQSARLDALILLEHVTGIDRAHILAEPEREISTLGLAKLKKLLTERAKHVPIAYLLGHSEFYDRTFMITPQVLVPRPESETMITLLKSLAADPKSAIFDKKGLRIADVGTGSGALGITAQLELPDSQVDLLDVDQAALANAKTNVDLFTPGLRLLRTDLLVGSPNNYDILLCNLPYVPDGYQINRAAGFEPKIALYGGPDGLDLYRKLFTQLKMVEKKPLYILFEALLAQHDELQALAATYSYRLTAQDGLIQVFGPQ